MPRQSDKLWPLWRPTIWLSLASLEWGQSRAKMVRILAVLLQVGVQTCTQPAMQRLPLPQWSATIPGGVQPCRFQRLRV